MAAVKRAWVPLVIMVLVTVAGFAVYRLHGAFGVHGGRSAVGARADDIRPFNPKRVILEVFGEADSVADINYLDVDAAPQHVDDMRLPWTYSVATTAPAVSVNVVAQGDSDVISCRITVNGQIKDQRTVAGIHPQTFCLVKSA
jgi:Mycobacterium membrane protein